MNQKEIRNEQAKQYMVLAKIKGEVEELRKVVDECIKMWAEGVQQGKLVTDRMFDMMLAFSNDISELIKEYLASKPEIV